jgi:RNA polymerase sigma-70 factor (ECF subfamily)
MAAATSEEDLLRRSAAGDEGAFSALYLRRQAGIYRYALHMCGSGSEAEEVSQEVFLTVIREGGRFDPSRGSVQSYLYGIARNQVLRVLQRDRVYAAFEDEAGADSVQSGDDPLRDLTRTQSIEAVRHAVLRLPENYREAVVLCDLEEMTYADAADALGVPIGTVRSRVNRGRALLVEKLKASWRPGRVLA